MFNLLPRMYIYTAIVVAAIGAFSWFVYSIKQDAKNEVLQEIKGVEDAARKKAVDGARTVNDCYNADGVWDRAAGSCRLPEGQR